MRVTRFCSAEEFQKFINGETLHNNTIHQRINHGSKSVGFCFVEDEPEVAFRYLKGIVDLDYCIVLDFEDGHLKPSVGAYNVGGANAIIIEKKREWCCEWYNNKVATLVYADKHYAQLAPSRRDLKRMFGI